MLSNDVIECILSRRSVRAYKNKPVSAEQLRTVVECGRWATSSMNTQPWFFSVVTDRELLDRITEGVRSAMLNGPPEARRRAQEQGFDTFYGARAAIIVSGTGPDAAANCANAVENMALAAHSLGLAGCYIGSFKLAFSSDAGEELKRALGVPEAYEPQFAFAVGYADEAPLAKPRAENKVVFIAAKEEI